MADRRISSADSHFVEPPNMWEKRIDKKFKHRAPHMVKGLHGRVGEFFVCENISPIPVAAAFGAGVPSEQLPEHNKKGFEAAPASVWDPAARLKDLHEQQARDYHAELTRRAPTCGKYCSAVAGHKKI